MFLGEVGLLLLLSLKFLQLSSLMKWRLVTVMSKRFERVSLKDDSFLRKAGVTAL